MSDAIADRFAATTKRYGINPRELFEDFDRGHTGFLLPAVFKQALLSANFPFNATDAERLQGKYLEGDKINYRRFVQDVLNPRKVESFEPSESNLSQLIEFGSRLQSEGLSVIDVLGPYDRLKTGRVKFDVFLRAFGLAKTVQDIGRSYMNEATQEVNYRVLNEDLKKARQRKNDQELAVPLPQFWENFVRCVVARVVNIDDAFIGADRYHHGKLPTQLFLSIVSSWNIDLTPAQLKELAQPFTANGEVNYQAFVRSVHETADGLDSQPEVPQNDVPPTDVDALLSALKSRIAARRIRVRDQFELAVTESDGNLSRGKFYKILGFCGFSCTPADIKALDAEFLCRDDAINITAFLNRVDPIAQTPSTPDSADIVAQLRKHLLHRNLSIARSFAPFDREKSGLVTIPQVVSVLNSVNFRPTNPELVALCQRFGDGRTVHYRDLCAEVDPSAFTSPQSPVPAAARPPSVLTPPASPVSTPPRSPSAQTFLRRVADAADLYKVDFRNECGRLDFRRSGLLSMTSVKELLEGLQLRVGLNEVIGACRPYCAPGTDTVAYNALCDDLDQLLPPRPSASEDPEVTRALRVFAAAISNKRLACEELFRGHDFNRSGNIHTNVLRAAIAPIRAFLTEEIISIIENEYRDRRQPERFSWRRLAAAVAGVTPTPEDVAAAAEVRRQESGENEGVGQLLNSIKGRISARRKRAVDLFLNVVDDEVTQAVFRGKIAGAGITITEAEFAKLIRTFTGTQGGVAWKAFCEGVEAAQPMEYR
jgi:Ca2+-binding EF-hand superfamily protein